MNKRKGKPTKLFFGNQYKTSLYASDGKWQRRFRMAKLYASCLLLVGVIGVQAAMLFAPKPAEAEPEVVVRTITVHEKGTDIRTIQDELLNELAECETGGVKDQDGAIILDTNNRMSIGRYQWQRESVIYYYKELYEKEITNREAIEISINPETASDLTRDVLFTTEDGYTNWLNCNKKIGLSTKVEWIQKLAK